MHSLGLYEFGFQMSSDEKLKEKKNEEKHMKFGHVLSSFTAQP